MEEYGPQIQAVDTVEGVRIEKSYEGAEFQFPSIVYELSSNREQAARVRIEDQVPPEIGVENVGFHTSYGRDDWEIEGNRLVFTYELDPGEEHKTVYAVRSTDSVDPVELCGEPERVEVTPPVEAAAESAPLTRSSEDAPYEEEATSTDLDAQLEALGEESADVSDLETRIDPEDSLLDRLAAEIEADDHAADSLEVVRSAIVAGEAGSGSQAARLAQIEDDMAKLRAYTGALEAFLDETGGAEAVIDRFEERLASVEADLEAVRSSTEAIETELESVHADTAELDEEVTALSTTLDDVSGVVEVVREDVDDLEAAMPDYSIDDRFDDLAGDLEDMEGFVDNLRSAFD